MGWTALVGGGSRPSEEVTSLLVGIRTQSTPRDRSQEDLVKHCAKFGVNDLCQNIYDRMSDKC